MKCEDCENNYLHKIFKKCMKESKTTDYGLIKFDKICAELNDPRNPLTIIYSMYNGNCKECESFKKYYIEFINKNL